MENDDNKLKNTINFYIKKAKVFSSKTTGVCNIPFLRFHSLINCTGKYNRLSKADIEDLFRYLEQLHCIAKLLYIFAVVSQSRPFAAQTAMRYRINCSLSICPLLKYPSKTASGVEISTRYFLIFLH